MQIGNNAPPVRNATFVAQIDDKLQLMDNFPNTFYFRRWYDALYLNKKKLAISSINDECLAQLKVSILLELALDVNDFYQLEV